MMIAHEQTARLDLTTPLTSCCNCGARATTSVPVELVDTPLRRTRFFFFFGTELTILETFPYCKHCRASAGRVRSGWFSKFLVACLMCTILVIVMTFVAPSLVLPATVNDNFFMISAVASLLVTFIYFQYRESKSTERSYYQPVSLVEVEQSEITSVTLRLTNRQYAQELTRANAEMIRVGMLKIISMRDQ
jgi:heme/copper-type cytochrome/quinol oxidase subunit 4